MFQDESVLILKRDWMEDWDIHQTPINKRKIKCDDNQKCEEFLRMYPDDFPCYKGSWSKYPCYKGRRYGCAYYTSDSSDKQRRPIRIERCWYETLYFPYYWDWAIKDPNDRSGRCSYHVECREVSSKMIDLIGEM